MIHLLTVYEVRAHTFGSFCEIFSRIVDKVCALVGYNNIVTSYILMKSLQTRMLASYIVPEPGTRWRRRGSWRRRQWGHAREKQMHNRRELSKRTKQTKKSNIFFFLTQCKTGPREWTKQWYIIGSKRMSWYIWKRGYSSAWLKGLSSSLFREEEARYIRPG